MLIAHVAGLPVEEALPAAPALAAGAWLVLTSVRLRLGSTSRRGASRGPDR